MLNEVDSKSVDEVCWLNHQEMVFFQKNHIECLIDELLDKNQKTDVNNLIH